MSYHLKFIIPLLDDEIELKDLSTNAGFIDAYTNDTNKPYLDNHIFLLYLANLNVKESYDRTIKFKHLKSLYGIYDMRIKGVLCKLYVFTISNRAINRITENVFMLSNNDRLKILTFWKTTDADINEFFVKNIDTPIYNFKKTSVPEMDYENLYVRIQNKGDHALCA